MLARCFLSGFAAYFGSKGGFSLVFCGGLLGFHGDFCSDFLMVFAPDFLMLFTAWIFNDFFDFEIFAFCRR